MNPQNPLNLPAELPIARYRFQFMLDSDLKLPEYAGSTLRGVFGHALRRAACMTRQKECSGCPLLESCPYTRIFAAPASSSLNRSQQQTPPQPYIIEAPEDGRRHYAAGEPFSFDIVLLGRARQQLPLIAHAFDRAFQRGIGATWGQGRLNDIHIETPKNWQSIYSDGHILPHSDSLPLPQAYPEQCTLRIRTPMRLQSQGSVLGIHRIKADILLRQLMRRVSTIAATHWQQPINADFGRLSAAAAEVGSCPQLQWRDWNRYSNRQQREMTLGGITGTWQLQDLPLEFSQLLHIGQWLHIGKETVFGLGRYELSRG
ncbi:CRISPR system precrRNA processing endoribonuclease RAMP protein Cas6 [Uruburuella testudinis]|uniref:CRISPR system precrRNA processing endoribonuclease RAMP protein Cas6 n=1 Tax=Uruburuella testudinis TaxID=1282863 RepID=A0ABY4DS53_9NEIS|nr:CRISPR system precrRNA processing endoribonuclease RAMP protein Cas6 [Uruburuella testudinis]UOO81238.1 CRISPR system precrRNA processing endoribonuclease RAMP protein Cas6 [Uruburuella testudinis]